ncbi:restriction endonuclease subunit S [Streptococcus suis]|uniref:restriction endonuclease subunit S n=1 Tax=Streptococcus suis TaxID=1307 RepID=UPI00201A97CC|nr:restriction endonuclease subunit S [Streptococcus suis]MCL4897969.1 restriction endonuclease subunit S [Streptococcus suis]
MTKEKSTVPRLRFPGFTTTWKQRKLGEVADFSIKTNSLSRDKLSSYFYEVQNIHYGDILTKYDAILDVCNKELPSIIGSTISDFVDALLIEGDIVFADAAEDSTVGKAVEVRNFKGKNVVSGLHTIVARPKVSYAPYYLGYLINSTAYHNQILPLMQGTKVSSISKANLKSTTVVFPTLPEQEVIGSFFSDLDQLITLHQRKLDDVKELKKALLQKMFPKGNGNDFPELRFPEFTDAWKQRKLGEVGYAKSGVGFPEEEQGGTTGIPFFKVSDMNTNGNENELVVANNYVTDEQISKRKWRVITEVPAIFFAKVGAAVMLNRKRLIRHPFLLDNNTMTYVFNHTQWDTNFGKTLFETIDLIQLTQVGALPSYNSSDVENINISLPTLPEQEAIGSFFSDLDQLITLHQRQLDHLKLLKKALLQQMFI